MGMDGDGWASLAAVTMEVAARVSARPPPPSPGSKPMRGRLRCTRPGRQSAPMRMSPATATPPGADGAWTAGCQSSTANSDCAGAAALSATRQLLRAKRASWCRQCGSGPKTALRAWRPLRGTYQERGDAAAADVAPVPRVWPHGGATTGYGGTAWRRAPDATPVGSLVAREGSRRERRLVAGASLPAVHGHWETPGGGCGGRGVGGRRHCASSY